MRDLEHIVLYTICMKISEVTGISTGKIMAKMPDIQFVNIPDGSTAAPADTKFPCVGMKYSGDIKYKINKYGDKHKVFVTPESIKIYEPLGEIWIPLTIYLFTNSRKEQRELGNKIGFYLATTPMQTTIGDELPNEYFSIIYECYRDLNELRPFARAYDLKINGRILQEVSGYIVEEISTNIVTKIKGNISQPETLTNTITGDSYIDEDVTITYGISEDGVILVTEDGVDIAFEI